MFKHQEFVNAFSQQIIVIGIPSNRCRYGTQQF